MKLNLKQFKIQILLGVFFLIIIPLSYFVIQKLLNKIVDNITTKQNLQVEREIYMSNASEIPKLRKNIKYIAENNDKINVLKDDSDEINTALYDELEKIARRTGNHNPDIKLPEYQKANPVSLKNKKKFTIKPKSSNFSYITITMEGTFNEAMNFLHAVDNMEYISDVLLISIEKPKKVEEKRIKGEVDKYSREKILKSKFGIVFYLKDTENLKKGKEGKDPDPNVDMKLVEQRKKSQLPNR